MQLIFFLLKCQINRSLVNFSRLALRIYFYTLYLPVDYELTWNGMFSLFLISTRYALNVIESSVKGPAFLVKCSLAISYTRLACLLHNLSFSFDSLVMFSLKPPSTFSAEEKQSRSFNAFWTSTKSRSLIKSSDGSSTTIQEI